MFHSGSLLALTRWVKYRTGQQSADVQLALRLGQLGGGLWMERITIPCTRSDFNFELNIEKKHPLSDMGSLNSDSSKSLWFC